MNKNLYDAADAVETERDFLDFIQLLIEDREDEEEKELSNPSSPYAPGANGWENGTISAYLGAAIAWGTGSINGMPYYTKPSNPWKRAAQILHAGKFYE